MFGVSFFELILVMVLALIVFGPEKLPEIARTLGKTFAMLKKESDSFRKDFYNSVYKPLDDANSKLKEQTKLMVHDLQSESTEPVKELDPPEQNHDSVEKQSDEH